MPRPGKGGRRKNSWDIKATIDALNRRLGDQPDPKGSNPRESLLHTVREICRYLDTNMSGILALDNLFRLMHENADPIRRYARRVTTAFRTYRPFAVQMNDLLRGGAEDDLWNLWFFACEMPRRLHVAMVTVDRLLYAGTALMPRPFSIPGFHMTAARAAIVLGLQSYGYDLPAITAILDPVGASAAPVAARDRVRKEVRRLQRAASAARLRRGIPTPANDSGPRGRRGRFQKRATRQS